MRQELRLHIDGEWKAQEFSDFFLSLQSLSYYAIADMEYRFAPSRADSLSLGRLRKHNATLNVRRIEYASPGFTDLAGFGAILSEIRQFLEFLITHIGERKQRQLDLEHQQVDLEHKKLELQKTKLEVINALETSNLNQSAAKLVEIQDVTVLIEAIEDGRLTKVELVDLPDE
mmetsp:Transcript_23602/g.41810  ORF Transcript_23602/g.41810 Transcript_23602/m.41810 type:complete len:173 (-) Transcript_23602:191-709(-)